MSRPRIRNRAGITLTEILISILIMGVGLVSVASLFPIGMMRIRDAVNDSRSTLAAGSAVADIEARDLLNPRSFIRSGWYPGRNPLVVDSTGLTKPALGPGLPFAYDPLFWSTLHFTTANDADPITPVTRLGRFGSGVGFVRDGTGAAGLQRLTNFVPYLTTFDPQTTRYLDPFTYTLSPAEPAFAEVAGDIFSSIDDPVMQTDGPQVDIASGIGSPLVPQNVNPGGPFSSERDYRFTWMLTVRPIASESASTYTGEIVLFHNRPIGLDPQTTPSGGAVNVAAGERVVEAVWGHTNSLVTNPGYSQGDDRLVLLRWPVGSPDPNVPVGSWIADVTYVADPVASAARYGPGSGAQYPGQRIHWYRVTQRSTPEPDPASAVFNGAYRRMTVRIDRPVQAKTPLRIDGGQVVPVYAETALINNYVINVFPQVFYSR